MGLFVCDNCNVVENTALCRYWLRKYPDVGLDGRALCSDCLASRDTEVAS